jgi:hypothetical protein
MRARAVERKDGSSLKVSRPIWPTLAAYLLAAGATLVDFAANMKNPFPIPKTLNTMWSYRTRDWPELETRYDRIETSVALETRKVNKS